MSTSSWFSRITFAATTGLGVALGTGGLNPKYAAYSAIALAVLQAFQQPVQASGNVSTNVATGNQTKP